MERLILGTGPRHVSVLLATCAAHAAAIYLLSTHAMMRESPLWSALEVTFVAVEKKEPPAPPAIPVLLRDAFAEQPLIEIPAPQVELGISQDGGNAIHTPPPPEPIQEPSSALEEGSGYGPVAKPRVIGGPKNPQDRYPRASIRNRESGRSIVTICISDTGSVESVDLAQSSGYRRLDEAALDMALDYRFMPATREGQAVAVCLPYGIDFRVGVGGRRRH